ncbi:saccharopine dehydrogenase-like oxidoreductase [Anneissia japonica]|uniref:saccharopine dehydrogenase-like oxidoreductase n=1 Tax=Anneissia japonica TaxID=1529436 RepID=UPI0014256976|nr:saccharopine dehydrogenase-like oxidoreductase [Anneissia japonica]
MASPESEVERIYDILVFGASGFTGQFVVEELARVTDAEKDLRWAIAGRNSDKLRGVLLQAQEITGKTLEHEVDIVVANVNDEASLKSMCLQSKVILNCVGPYRFFGEQLVRACVENGCHHIDISGEPQFLEGIQLNYDEKAQNANVYVIGSCGFDSIPADMGVCFVREHFPGILNTIESFLMASGGSGTVGHYGTWQSAIHGFANAKELISLRKQFKHEPLPRYKPRLTKRSSVFFHEPSAKWAIPFPGSDVSVVRRTQRFMFEKESQRPIQFGAYATVSSFFSLLMLIVGGLLFSVLAKFKFGRNLLEKYPRLFSFGAFSHEGPSRKHLEKSSFTFTFYSEGFSTKEKEEEGQHDRQMITKVSGPEPGYVATPIAMIQSAFVLLKESSKLPGKGGVFTPGAAFAKTSLIKRLTEHGFHFNTVSEAQPI